MGIPQTVDGLTPEWLTDVLADVVAGGRVVGVRADDIGTGVGVFGTIARLHLTYDGGVPAGAPATMIDKLPTAADANRNVGIALGLYVRENEFYDRVAVRVPFRVPRCYASQFDLERNEFLLLMEDLGKLEAGDQLAGISLPRALTIVRALAAFHAQWWDSPDLHALDWLPPQDAPTYLAVVPGIITAGVAALKESPLRATLPDGSIELADLVDEHSVALLRRCGTGPQTFVHGDVRLDNLFFGPDGDDFALIDWQLSLRGRGAYDVVWLLATSMNVDDQNQHAHTVLRAYHEALVAHGVRMRAEDLDLAAAECAAYLLCGPLSLVGTFDFAEAGDGRAAQLTAKWVPRGFNLARLFGAAEAVRALS